MGLNVVCRRPSGAWLKYIHTLHILPIDVEQRCASFIPRHLEKIQHHLPLVFVGSMNMNLLMFVVCLFVLLYFVHCVCALNSDWTKRSEAQRPH